MRRAIILTSIVIIFVAGGVTSYLYFASLQKVSVVLHSGVTGAKIYQSNNEDDHEGGAAPAGNPIETLTASKELSLTKGRYYAIPEGGKDLLRDQIVFTVENKPLTVDIDPDLTADALAKQLASQTTAIQQAITVQFPLIGSDYTVASEKLFKKGEWYGALLTGKNDDPSAPGDYYRVVAHKEDGTWKVIKTPVLVLTTAEFTTVPKAVLTAINQLNV